MPRRISLSLELLQTFLALLRHNGDAADTARDMGINQPSMSKRLSFFQHAGRVVSKPWLEREGKKWHLTEEGQRVLPAVEDIVQRYDRLQEFIDKSPEPQVAFACGQQAAGSFVQRAVARFAQAHPGVRIRLGTPRGQARIERVANGSLDLAIVSHEDDAIREIARRPLYIEPLRSDPLVLVGLATTEAGKKVEQLADGKVKPRDLVDLPLIVTEPDAGARRSFDQAMKAKNLFHALDFVMEVGGWSTILTYVAAGLGVGLVSAEAAKGAKISHLVTRALDAKVFPPVQERLIARRKSGTQDQADLSDNARALHDLLLEAARGE